MDPVMIGDAFRMKTWKHHPNATDWVSYNCPNKDTVAVFVYMGNERRDGSGPRVNPDAVITGMGWVHREDIPVDQKELVSKLWAAAEQSDSEGRQHGAMLRQAADTLESVSSLNSTLSVELAAHQANELAARLEGVVIGLGYALKAMENNVTAPNAVKEMKAKLEVARREAIEVRGDATALTAKARQAVIDAAFPTTIEATTQPVEATEAGATATGSMSAPSPSVNGTASVLLSHMVSPEPFTTPLEVMEEAPTESAPAPVVRTYAQGVLEGMETIERIVTEGPDLDTVHRKIHSAKTMVRTHIARES